MQWHTFNGSPERKHTTVIGWSYGAMDQPIIATCVPRGSERAKYMKAKASIDF